MIEFRMAGLKDFPAVSRIMRDAVSRMLCAGRSQWDESYPADTHIYDDIVSGCGYVLESDAAIAAYGAVVFDGEPAYDFIDGEWLSDSSYVAVHRMAVAERVLGRGFGAMFMHAVENFAADRGIGAFRIDTNYDNAEMLRLLDRCGFEQCGIIHYPKGERIAFEKLI